MYKELDSLIMGAMKAGDTKVVNVLRLIKSEMLKAVKNGVEMTEASEAKILQKMVSQRKDSIEMYLKGGRQDLVDAEKEELGILEGFMPKQATDEEIEEFTKVAIGDYQIAMGDDYVITMKDMKPIMSLVQTKYPTANGKIISKVLQQSFKK